MSQFPHISRRGFLASSAVLSATAAGYTADQPSTFQASGVKVGEVTGSTAIIWTRLTENPTRNASGVAAVGKTRTPEESLPDDISTMQGACPGMAGSIRVRYGLKPDLADAQETDWVDVGEEGDFSHQFHLKELPANRTIHFAVDTREPGKMHGSVTGQFQTAPKADAKEEITFALVTCQMFADLDHEDGFHIYPAIAKLDPRFVSFTGDNVYYDNERPRAVNPRLARYHWERMYSLPRHVELLRSVATTWQKDDHDLLKDDCWPGQKMGDLTFEEGLKIFRKQVPIGEEIYRSFRWGRFLEVWFMEGRDFRSPNNSKDGPNKTIWGQEQKDWFYRTMKASDATWKVIVTPTPIVGPDRPRKNDNHANDGFRHEGDEIRHWLRDNCPANAFTVCGDRHWQYHSVHPETGLNEFSIGASSDEHAGGTPGLDETYHRFHRVKGGFLSITAKANEIVFRHHDIHGKVVYEKTFTA